MPDDDQPEQPAPWTSMFQIEADGYVTKATQPADTSTEPEESK